MSAMEILFILDMVSFSENTLTFDMSAPRRRYSGAGLFEGLAKCVMSRPFSLLKFQVLAQRADPSLMCFTNCLGPTPDWERPET